MRAEPAESNPLSKEATEVLKAIGQIFKSRWLTE